MVGHAGEFDSDLRPAGFDGTLTADPQVFAARAAVALRSYAGRLVSLADGLTHGEWE